MKKSPDRAKGATTEVPGEYLMCERGGGDYQLVVIGAR
jgi:hypothetical protein